jgi:hypothetical protein
MACPQTPQETKGVSQKETLKEEKSWGTLPNLQHFGGRRVCWNSRTGLGRTHKQKFKVKLTCTTKKRQLMQVK